MSQETAFEKPRGISNVETRDGYAQVHVSRLAEPIVLERMRVLSAIAEAGISLDFFKLTPSGVSFLVPEDCYQEVENALQPLEVHFSINTDRSIVLVHAVNMRDEEGLIATILKEAIATGVEIFHIGDMHDRLLLVVQKEDVERLVTPIQENLVGVLGAH